MAYQIIRKEKNTNYDIIKDFLWSSSGLGMLLFVTVVSSDLCTGQI